jgi:hypothetical protein
VDLEHRAELVVAKLVRHAVPRVPGVVDDDVELAESLDGRAYDPLGHALLRQVASDDCRLAVDRRRRLLGDVGVQVGEQQPRAVCRQQLRGGAPDAARRAGDDRDLAVEHPHSLHLSRDGRVRGCQR